MNARYYAGAAAKFVSEDPVFLFVGDPLLEQKTGLSLQDYLSDPQGLNSYSYVKNRPLLYVDPEGEAWREAWRISYGSWATRNYIRYGGLNLRVADSNINGVSRIYNYSKGFSKGDPSVALAISALSVRTSSIGLESRSDRIQRVLNLPSGLLGEYSLQGEGDNTDKLQHFFASATLSYMTSEFLTEIVGVGIEVFEDIVGSSFDMNDVLANKLGAEFGQLLSQNPNSSLENFLSSKDTSENRSKVGTNVKNNY